MNPLAQLKESGQSFWLDSLSRTMLEDGSLKRRIRDQGLRGITSNPSIFAKAMASSPAYDDSIRRHLSAISSGEEAYECLAADDVRDACDLLMPVYRQSDAEDGYVSREVSPHLAYDPLGTVRRARALWATVARPNLLTKVPGTPQGLRATKALLQDGVNVNVTLLFGLGDYRDALEVHIAALEERAHRGLDVHGLASVASLFLSRIDVAVDRELARRIHPRSTPESGGTPASCGARARSPTRTSPTRP